MTNPTEADIERARKLTPYQLRLAVFDAIRVWHSEVITWETVGRWNAIHAALDAYRGVEISAARAEGIAQGRAEQREIDAPVIEAATQAIDELMAKGEVSAEAQDDLVTLLATRALSEE